MICHYLRRAVISVFCRLMKNTHIFLTKSAEIHFKKLSFIYCIVDKFSSCVQQTSLHICLLASLVRFKELSNNHLQIRGIKKTDEGPYTCEGRLMARGEIDFRIIKVIVNGG